MARTRAETFAIGLEPSIDGLRQTARALIRRPLPNVALLVTAVEAAELDAIADEVTVHFPWGPLLDAALGEDADVLAAVASLAKPGAPVRILVSATARDGRASLTRADLEGLRPRYRAAGLELVSVRPASCADVDAARSTWGKRLGAGRSRPAFVVRARRR